MNIEDLTKTQLLLLTLLVNFVTSIATGVLTVSLLDQAPPTVVQTVNRIVDHTINTVTTEVPVIGKTPTPVPSTEDLLTQAIAEDTLRTITVSRVGVSEILARGFYISSSRTLYVVGAGLPSVVSVTFSNGSQAEAQKASDGLVSSYTFSADTSIPETATPTLIASSAVKQGQTVIALTAEGSVVTGIVTRIDTTGIFTDLPSLLAGITGVNLSGDVIGITDGSGKLIPTEAFVSVSVP